MADAPTCPECKVELVADQDNHQCPDCKTFYAPQRRELAPVKWEQKASSSLRLGGIAIGTAIGGALLAAYSFTQWFCLFCDTSRSDELWFIVTIVSAAISALAIPMSAFWFAKGIIIRGRLRKGLNPASSNASAILATFVVLALLAGVLMMLGIR